MIKRAFYAISTIVILGITACSPWDFDEVAFLEVNTIDLFKLSSNSVQIRGSISGGADKEEMIEYGFCWSLVDMVPDMGSENTKCIPLTGFDPSIEFKDTLNNLPFDAILNVRAYAYFDNRLFYGVVKSTQTGRIELTVDEVSIVDFETAIVEGTILGLGQGVTEITQYGHCWSQEESNPAIGCPSCSCSEFDPRNENGFFVSSLENLQPGQEYFIRSYAIYSSQDGVENQIYSPVKSFRISDIWAPRENFHQERFGAVSFTIGDYGYIGLGYDKSVRFVAVGIEPIKQLIPTNEFHKYSFTTNSWVPENSVGWIPAGKGRLHAVSFVIDDKAYVGTGYAPDLPTGSQAEFYKDFWIFDGENWHQQIFEFPCWARYGAVGFSLGGRGYIGLGKDKDGNVLRDFWVFDPVQRAWDSIPAAFRGMPRWGATSFVINDTAYVGLGEGASENLYTDFYRFDGNCWIQTDDFPEEARKGAVGLAIGNKGYVGMGETSEGIALSDFWEFDPGNQVVQWKERTGLGSIGQIRTFSSSLEYQDRGFAGMGLAKVSIAEHGFEYELSLFDFFEYFPEE